MIQIKSIDELPTLITTQPPSIMANMATVYKSVVVGDTATNEYTAYMRKDLMETAQRFMESAAKLCGCEIKDLVMLPARIVYESELVIIDGEIRKDKLAKLGEGNWKLVPQS